MVVVFRCVTRVVATGAAGILATTISFGCGCFLLPVEDEKSSVSEEKHELGDVDNDFAFASTPREPILDVVESSGSEK